MQILNEIYLYALSKGVKFIGTKQNGDYQGLGDMENEEFINRHRVSVLQEEKNSKYLLYNNVNILNISELNT